MSKKKKENGIAVSGNLKHEIVLIKGNEAFSNTIIISEGTGYSHSILQRKMRDYSKDFEELGKVSFENRPLESGQLQKVYLLNEMQSTYLITLLENNEIVRKFKLTLVKEFFRMRQFILEKQSSEWQQSRLTGKQSRRDETDVILFQLIPLAETQGSNNSGKLYLTYSKLINSTLNIGAGQRDNLPSAYIDAIRFLERAISNIISIEVNKGTYYKEIYQICKAKCQIIKELAFLPSLKLIGA